LSFKNILCLTSLPSEADETAMRASKLADRHGANIIFINVISTPDTWSVLFPHHHEDETRDKPRLVKDASDSLVEQLTIATGRPQHRFRVIVETGSVDSVVVAKAQALNCDLIVLPGGMSWSRILRHAHCPVMIVRDQRRGGVLAATDLSDPSLPALSAARLEAQTNHQPLTAMTSLDFAEITPLGPGGELGAYVYSQEQVSDMTKAIRDHLEHAMQNVEANGDMIIEFGPPTEAILRTAQKLNSDLIVMGSRERTLLPRLLLGSVAEAVAREARCSVLVVRLTNSRKSEAA